MEIFLKFLLFHASSGTKKSRMEKLPYLSTCPDVDEKQKHAKLLQYKILQFSKSNKLTNLMQTTRQNTYFFTLLAANINKKYRVIIIEMQH